MNLPKKYTPESLRTKQSKMRRESIMYGIGIEHTRNEFGMIDGTTNDIFELLETEGAHKERIIRFNEDGTDDVLYKWALGAWHLKKGRN